MSVITPVLDDPTRDYGDRVVAVEPGGVEAIPLDERHGRSGSLFWTWTSPNMEFATIGVGFLGPLYFGLSFWQTVWAIVLGTALGSASHGVLSAWGPGHGLPQMVMSRTAFGFLGNILPAGINAVVAGIGWFAVNSVSGALALNALIHAPKPLCLIIVVAAQIVIAFFGHNLVHAFERFAFPVLTLVFVVACIVVLSKAHPGAPAAYDGGVGGFLIVFGAAFGYAAGWNPYAADYTRYLPPDTARLPVALSSAAGVFFSCVLLEVAGAATVTAGGKYGDINPSHFTDLLPTWLGKLTLLAICLGAVAANALNIYSGSISFMALGIRFPTHWARAAVALLFGLVGFFVALAGLHNAGQTYEDFLLVISYWIGPWLGVVFVDRVLRRGKDRAPLMAQQTDNVNWAGPIAMALGIAVSVWLFSNQLKYVGPIPKHHPAFGDITFEVGFVLAAVLYAVLFRALSQKAMVVVPAKASVPADTAEVSSEPS